MKFTFSLVLLLSASALCACSEPVQKTVETRILCVWDSADLDIGGASFGAFPITPHLAAWRAEGHVQEHGQRGTPSSSSAFASLLTGVSAEQHGLRSIAELGASRVLSTLQTRAQSLPASTVRLGSVSGGHFALQGLSRGVGNWLAPAQVGEQWNADQVWGAIGAPLDAALAGESPVFLVLHFNDLRADSRGDVEPSDELLKAGLAPWIGKGGEIDEAFAAQDKDQSLAKRLSRKLSRRKEDPRREALQRCYEAAALNHLDGILGGLREQLTHHRRLGSARLELDLGATPESSLSRGQSVRVTSHGDFEDLSTKLRPANGEKRELSPGEALELPTRGSPFLLQFKHPQLYNLGVDNIQVGDKTLGDSDVFLLLAGRSDPWPEHAFTGPLLDFQKAGGRRMSCRVDAPEGAAVELLLTSFPPTEGWIEGVEVPDGVARPHESLPGVAHVSGTGRLSFSMLQPSPSARLGVVLRVDGARVNGSRMRYLKRSFITSDRLDLGFSSASWIDEALRGEAEAPESSAIHAQLLDSVALLPGVELFSPSERARLNGLHENE